MTFLDRMNEVLGAINSVIWADWVLYVVLGVGVLFTLWSGFCQYRALAHGTAVTAGKYDDKSDPGAINHFRALSAAPSATVGPGNVGGGAGAIAPSRTESSSAVSLTLCRASHASTGCDATSCGPRRRTRRARP